MTTSNLKTLALTAIILSLGAVSGHAQEVTAPTAPTTESKMFNPGKIAGKLEDKLKKAEQGAKDAVKKLGDLKKKAQDAGKTVQKVQNDLVTAGQNATDEASKKALNKAATELNDVTKVYSDMAKL